MIIKLPTESGLRNLLALKIREYDQRLEEASEQDKFPTRYKHAIAVEVLVNGEADTEEIKRRMIDKYGVEAFDAYWFQMASDVINDYCLNGGANCIKA